MIARWLARRRDHAAIAWHRARRRSIGPTPELTSARRRLNRWDALLDLWTAGER